MRGWLTRREGTVIGRRRNLDRSGSPRAPQALAVARVDPVLPQAADLRGGAQVLKTLNVSYLADGNFAFNFSETGGDGVKRSAMVPVTIAEFLVLRVAATHLIPRFLGLA